MSFLNVSVRMQINSTSDKKELLAELVKTKGCDSLKEGEMLVDACGQAIKELEEAEQDHSKYIIVIKDENLKLEELQEEKTEELRDLYNEIKKLEDKQIKGTITEDEEKELESKCAELNARGKVADEELNSKNSELAAKNNQFLQEHGVSIDVYQDLANGALRDGKKYTEDKHDTFVWRIIKKIQLGENMLEAGKNLQNAINSYSQLTDTIKNANKVKTPEFSDVNAQTMTADTGDAEKENDKKEEI